MSQDLLTVSGVHKSFFGVPVLRDVSLAVGRGEVCGLVGENGAGKSTLMNILYGLYHPDEGEILLNGSPARIDSPHAAIDAGIGMVHQHFMLIPVMTVAENIVLATEPKRGGVLLDTAAAEKRVRDLADRFKFHIDPHARIQNITVGQQQRVEILKALYRNADILILDEPTAVLTPQEAVELFEILKQFVAQGLSVIFISHKLNELLDIADRVTVLRRGKKIDTILSEGATEAGLARMMVGREVLLRVEKTHSAPGESLLSVHDLRVEDDRGLEAVRGVSFDVRAGEIVAIAGVDGNGQTELIDAITGLRRSSSGTILVEGRELTKGSAHDFLEEGVGHIPEDRQRRGLVLEFTLAENLALHDYSKEPFSKWGFLSPGRVLERAKGLLKEFDVRGGRETTRASALSGGNQQKVVIAREVARNPKVLIAAQPTRGLDVGAIEFVHRRLVEQRDAGKAVLLISLELEEVVSLADRILVIYEGQIAGEFDPSVSEDELGMAMTGARVQEPAA